MTREKTGMIQHSVLLGCFCFFNVYGLSCIHISVKLLRSLFGSRPRPAFRMAVFTCNQMNRTNRTITTVCFNQTKHPLKSALNANCDHLSFSIVKYIRFLKNTIRIKKWGGTWYCPLAVDWIVVVFDNSGCFFFNETQKVNLSLLKPNNSLNKH